jgi:hypothetical protein
MKYRHLRLEYKNWKLPQGSVLGPLIFLVYSNDLPYIINKTSKPILYADDTSILCVNSNPSELVTAIKGILRIINEWFSINSLTLNLDKTNCAHFSSTSNIPMTPKFMTLII